MKKLLGGLLLACAAAAATPASAAIVYSDNFDDGAYVGAAILPNDFSDRWFNTGYFYGNSANGWTFTSMALIAQNLDDPTDLALLLNEPTGVASRMLTGLTIGQLYSVSLLLSGDNNPGSAYTFNGTIGGAPLFLVNGVDGARGSIPGTTLTAYFVANATSMELSFFQSSATSASPMIDNLVVASVPETGTWAMMIGGFGLMGGLMRRRSRKIAIA